MNAIYTEVWWVLKNQAGCERSNIVNQVLIKQRLVDIIKINYK